MSITIVIYLDLVCLLAWKIGAHCLFISFLDGYEMREHINNGRRQLSVNFHLLLSFCVLIYLLWYMFLDTWWSIPDLKWSSETWRIRQVWKGRNNRVSLNNVKRDCKFFYYKLLDIILLLKLLWGLSGTQHRGTLLVIEIFHFVKMLIPLVFNGKLMKIECKIRYTPLVAGK